MIFPVAEFPMPPLAPSLQECLGLAKAPVLRRVELAALQAEVEVGRLAPARFLTPTEQTAFAGFTFPKRRLEWLGGRLAAKAAALVWAGQPVTVAGLTEWQVSSAPDGRPELSKVEIAAEKSPRLELSISHSHGVAAALVVAGRPCGLDLQMITDTVVRVRERFCGEAEAVLLPGGGLRQEVGLTLLWTAKEALRKGRGGVPLTGFLAMQLVGVEELVKQGWCFRLAVAGAGEYPVVVFLVDDFAGAVSVR
jgi:phosphopantetheinyl transferase (holo-ACP synthase)